MGSKEKKGKNRSPGEEEQKRPKKSKSEAPIEERVKSPKKSKSDEFGSPKLQFNKECSTPLKNVKKKKKQKTQEVSEPETLPNHSSSDDNQDLMNGNCLKMGSKEKKGKKRLHREDEQKRPKKSESKAPIEERVKSPKKSKSDEFCSPKLQFNKECSTPLKSVKKKKKQKTQEGWSQSDVKELVQRIADHTRNVKSMPSEIVKRKIEWNEVKFKNYSEEQCHEKWMYLVNESEKFYTLENALTDAALWVKNLTIN